MIILSKSIELRINKYLHARCEAGSAIGCLQAGLYGKEMREDPRERLKFYKKACLLGNKESCEYEQLIPKSVAVYDCESKKIGASCNTVSKNLVTEDLKEAQRYAQMGCSLKSKESCFQYQEVTRLIESRAEEERRKSAAWAAALQGFAAGMQAANQSSGNSYSTNSFANNQPSYNVPTRAPATSKNVCNCKGYAGPGGPCYSGPGGPAYDGPGGPAFRGPGGPCYDGPGGV